MRSDAAVPVNRLEAALRWALLGTTLVLPCLTGFITTYILLLLTLLAIGLILVRRIEVRFDAPTVVFLTSFLGIAVLFALSARQPADVLLAANFAAFLIFAPLASLYRRGASAANSETVARLALAGAVVGAAVAMFEVFVLGAERAGLFVTDTIRLGNTAVLLGFLALIGLTGPHRRHRWVYLFGPVLALAVVLLTGARGAMLAYPALAFISLLFLIRRKWLALTASGLAVAALFLAAIGGLFGSARLASLLDVVQRLASGGPVGDEAVRIRLELYRAGWQAFQQSPLIGHGWAGLMPSVLPYLAEADKGHAALPHLHNEVLNFAVSGGLVGVAIYLVLIGMPVVLSLRSRRDSQSGARLFGASVLVAGYLVMGLPDTMLGFETHTALYVALVAVLLAFCRDPEPAA